MATYDPYAQRPYIGPGVTTVVGDPSNPWGGQVQPGQQNTYNPNETPEQAIIRLSRIGIPLEQIAQLVGVSPQEVVDVALRRRSRPGVPKTPATAAVTGAPTPPPAPVQRPPAIGIESITPDSDLSEMNQLIDQGLSVSDLATQQEIVPPDPQNYLTELAINETMSEIMPGSETEDADALDSENSLVKKLEAASSAGAAALGADNPDAAETFESMFGIQSLFGGPEEGNLQDRLEVYRDAAKIFFNTDELAKFVPEPDKALPFMVAGAALIQSGEDGDTWGSALAKSLSGYATSKYSEERQYQDRMLDLKMREELGVQKMAADLYIADRQAQLSLANAMFTMDRSPYRIGGSDSPQFLTDVGAQQLAQLGTDVVPWTADMGQIENYVLTNNDGTQRQVGLTSTDALRMSESGDYTSIEKGTMGDRKNYVVRRPGARPEYVQLTQDEAEARYDSGENIVQAPAQELIEVFDNQTKGNTQILASDLITQTQSDVAAGTLPRYMPISDMMNYAVVNGQPVFGSESVVMGILGQEGTRRAMENYQTLLDETVKNSSQVLSLIDGTRSLVRTAESEGQPILFAPVAGAVADLGRRVVNELDQLGTLFSARDADGQPVWNFTDDAGNPYGSVEGMQQSLDSSLENANLVGYLENQGINRVQAKNYTFRLALASAMLLGQKGRDISNEDIERFLNSSGGNASTSAELLTVLNTLEDQTLQYQDRTLNDAIALSPVTIPQDPNDPSSERIPLLSQNYQPVLDGLEGRPVTGSVNQETLAERRARVQGQRGMTPFTPPPSGAPVTDATLPANANEPSGYGTMTLEQVFQDVNSRNRTPDQSEQLLNNIDASLNDDQMQALRAYFQSRRSD